MYQPQPQSQPKQLWAVHVRQYPCDRDAAPNQNYLYNNFSKNTSNIAKDLLELNKSQYSTFGLPSKSGTSMDGAFGVYFNLFYGTEDEIHAELSNDYDNQYAFKYVGDDCDYNHFIPVAYLCSFDKLLKYINDVIKDYIRAGGLSQLDQYNPAKDVVCYFNNGWNHGQLNDSTIDYLNRGLQNKSQGDANTFYSNIEQYMMSQPNDMLQQVGSNEFVVRLPIPLYEDLFYMYHGKDYQASNPMSAFGAKRKSRKSRKCRKSRKNRKSRKSRKSRKNRKYSKSKV